MLHACRFRALNVQAGTQFCDSEFQAEVNSGRLSSGSLDNFSCIALAGVATEYLRSVRRSGRHAVVTLGNRLHVYLLGPPVAKSDRSTTCQDLQVIDCSTPSAYAGHPPRRAGCGCASIRHR